MTFDDEDLPSLDDIFSKPESIKRARDETEDESDDENKENIEKVEKVVTNSPLNPKKVQLDEDHVLSRDALKTNTPVFVHVLTEHKIVPGIVIGSEEDGIYTVKCYDGEIIEIGRRFIYCTTDTQFYSITPVPLKTILSSKNILVRPFVKENILKLVEEQKEVLIKILKGEVESERDLIFRSGKRFSMNSENSPGPFTLEEYNFLLEYFPDILIPKFLETLRPLLEERFEKSGKGLDHLLRQYSYLVLVPEFTARHILKVDSTVKTLEEANLKLLNNSTAYDQETGNFINYLYSKQDMYKYARRERNNRADE